MSIFLTTKLGLATTAPEIISCLTDAQLNTLNKYFHEKLGIDKNPEIEKLTILLNEAIALITDKVVSVDGDYLYSEKYIHLMQWRNDNIKREKEKITFKAIKKLSSEEYTALRESFYKEFKENIMKGC